MWKAFVVVAFCLFATAWGIAQEDIKGQLEVKTESRQLAGEPILMELSVKNVGEKEFYYWCGGPGTYPGAHFKAVIVDARGQEIKSWLSNGQDIMGSGTIETIKPGQVIALPAAIAGLSAGKYRLKEIAGEAEGHYPPNSQKLVVTWPAMKWAAGATIDVIDDPAAKREFEESLLERVRKGEPFAKHVATEFRVQSVLGVMVAELESDDPEVAERATDTLYGLKELPKGLGVVLKRSMMKRVKQEPLPKQLMAYMAALARRDGSDESLEAVLTYIHAAGNDLGRRRMLEYVVSFKQPKAAEMIREALSDGDKEVRTAAAIGLSKQRDPAAVTVLVEISKDLNSQDREEVLYCLADYWDDPRAVAAIEAAAKDPNNRAAATAMKALQRRQMMAGERAKHAPPKN